jgi:hypothetical protein
VDVLTHSSGKMVADTLLFVMWLVIAVVVKP